MNEYSLYFIRTKDGGGYRNVVSSIRLGQMIVADKDY